ncbi:NEDD4-binding protein 2-like 2 [Eleutherodactylus coqui]|uniref:NEDD4-binding protein 2-like 2 n=1 Tax=Eleutherodactylus coqui TaxID=57060 RepID=UPI003461EBD9
MWPPLRGLPLDASPEMPHAEKNLSYHVHDSAIEPCLKKSRPDYSSSSWVRRDTDLYKEHEAKSQKWACSTISEERSHLSNRSGSEGRGGGINVKYDSESYHLGQGDANERDRNKTNQHSFVLSKREKCENNSDLSFSGTSTSFIGPLYQPSAQEKPLAKVTNNLNAKPPPFKIATVALGKLASQSKGQDGMDYELRQFYKELNELGGEAGDQTKPPASTDLDVKQCIGPYPNDIPATPPSNQHHGQVPTSQPFPSTLPNLGTCHAREEPRPQLERPPLPLNIPFSRDSQAPYHPNNLSFESHAAPPSRFEGCHPSTFIVPHGPPPPRFNYPMSFPSNILPPQQSDNFSYSTRQELPPWHGSAAPPQSRFAPPMIPEPFSQGTGERTWQDLRYGDLSRQEDGQFGERTLPHAGNVPYEQYPCRSRDQSKRKMVLLRGVPGSGKSTLARTLLRESPDGVVLSTDDYFWQENVYAYDVTLLGDAHNWNQDRARRALDDSRPLVVIDNTNIKAWEMKPYVQMAVDRGYGVEFLEPDTWWKQDSHELEKRNTHRVPRETISKMLQRYDHDMTVHVVMNSVEPRLVRPNRPPPEAQPRWGASVDSSHNSSSFHSR